MARAKATRSLDVDENFKSTGDTRFTNGYCVALEKYLMSKLTPMPELKGTVNLKVHAGPGAKLSAITLDKEFNKDIPEATQKKVLLKCKAITGIPEPPFPLDFSLAVSNTADEFQVTRDINFGTYMADLQRRIKRAWFPPKGNESRRVVVTFTIWRDGRMAQPKLFQSSGVTIADNAALAAVQNAAPFRPLPDGSPHNVDVRFTIDYNVFTGKK